MIKNRRSVELPPGKGQLENGTDPAFISPQKIHFKYILDGFGRVRTDAGNRRTAYYTNIPPGDYTFRVIASNDGKEWSRTEGVITLVLKPHFYQTLIFKLISGLTVAWLCWICVRIRIRRLEANERKKLVSIVQRHRIQ